MRYAVMIYEDERIYGPDKTGPEMDKAFAAHGAFIQAAGKAITGGAGLKATQTATTVRTTDGRVSIHDGPFAETHQLPLSGYLRIMDWYSRLTALASWHSAQAERQK